MNVPLYYSKAPIIEAIIDFRFRYRPDIKLDDLLSIYDYVQNDYPQKADIYSSTVQLESQNNEPIKIDTNQQQIGFRYTSDDQQKIIQVGLDFLTINRLKPYTSWEPFRDEAIRIWHFYRKICQPTEIARLGVRFINRFEFPDSTINLRDYFLTVPEVSSGLSSISHFIMQLHLPQNDIRAMLVINMLSEQSDNPKTSSVILDFDLFHQESLSIDDSIILNYLEILRQRKNQAFQMSITEKTKELIR